MSAYRSCFITEQTKQLMKAEKFGASDIDRILSLMNRSYRWKEKDVEKAVQELSLLLDLWQVMRGRVNSQKMIIRDLQKALKKLQKQKETT